MAYITSIAVQKQNIHRFNIYVDNQFKLGVSEETLLAFRLKKGMLFTKDLEEQLLKHLEIHSFYTKALNYLSYGLRSEHQVREKLATVCEESSIIDTIIARLKQEKYINDLHYVRSFIQNNTVATKKGKYALKQSLLQKGIDASLIDQELIAFSDTTELTLAIENGEKYAKKQKTVSEKELVKKTIQFLITKGFSSTIAKKAVQTLDFSLSEEENYARLAKQADKLLKKYSKKYTANTLYQKLFQSLYQKGFSSEEITYYLKETLESEHD